MKKLVLLLLCSACFAFSTFAQKLTITGKIIDSSDDQPMIGAAVQIEGKTGGEITDANGNFSIDAQPGDVLIFSSLGKITKRIEASADKTYLVVNLDDDKNRLDEVVVIGYGTVKKRDLTGSVSQVKADDLLEGNPQTSINSALQGKVAGMQVRQNDGAPGGGLTIQIRGANSFSTNTQPLYVIDGLPYQGGGDMPDTGVGGSGSGSNPLANINPNDIESIEVLKDASSTAIYGSRGANGVIIITTKQGKSGKNNITFSSNFSISKVVKKIDVLDAVTYAKYMNEQAENGNTSLPYRGEWYYGVDENGNIMTNTGQYSPAPEDFLNPGIYTDQYGNQDIVGQTDWQDQIFQKGFTQEYNLSLDGGNEKGGYLLSMNYTKQKGTIVRSGFERYAVRSNSWRKVTPWLEADVNINYTNSKTDFVNSSVSGGDGVIYSALVFPPTYDPSINTLENNELNWLAANPYQYVHEAFDEYRANNVYISSYLDISIYKDLKLRENLGFSYSGNDRNTYYNRKTRQGYPPHNGTGGQATNWSEGIKSETLLTYNHKFGSDHDFNALIGVTFEQSDWKYNSMSGEDFPTDLTKMWDMSAAAKLNPLQSGRGRSRMQSNLARINYTFKSRYLFTASFRSDGSSVFEENNKYANFLSGAFAWKLSEEPWIKKLNFFDDLKLRVSYGQTGNQAIGSYATIPSLYVTGYVFNGNLSSGYAESTYKGPINKNLKWETTDQADMGLDMTFAQGRVSLTIDAYYKKTKDLLQYITIESNSGYNRMATNLGHVTNKGLEVTGSFYPNIGNDINWKIDANFSMNRNRIGGMPGDQYASQFINSIQNVFVLRNGCPIGTVVGYVEDGFYDNLAEVRADPQYANVSEDIAKGMIGEIKYRDYNKDGVITEADKRVIGDTNPDFTFGLTNTFSYKNLTFSFFFQGTVGNDIVNANTIANNTNASMTGISNITREQYDTRWRVGHESEAKWPKAISESYTREWRFTDRYIEDGSYIRLKNVNISYTFFPRRIKAVKNINLYLSASNLFTITNYSWYDPDVNAYGSDVSKQGVDLYSYPSSRTYSCGIKLSF